jgi:hypothetical protein
MPFCIGLPGAMKCQAIWFSIAQPGRGMKSARRGIVAVLGMRTPPARFHQSPEK